MSYIPFRSSRLEIFEWYLILQIIYSVTKYLIKRPVVYFLSSVSTLKNSSDMYVIRHIVIGTLFYRGTNFLNTLYIVLWICGYGVLQILSKPNKGYLQKLFNKALEC